MDLLWGYTGLLSLGQALFFSLGGYMLGMHLMLMIGEDGQYFKSGNNPNLLPDFMVFLGHTSASLVLEAVLLISVRRRDGAGPAGLARA